MLTVDLNSSAFLFSSLFIVYVLTALVLQPKFVTNNKRVIACNESQLQIVNETIAGIKQISLSRFKKTWLNENRQLDREMRLVQM